MDFMKVVDQAVREIKREVNIKVLKVPEIEQKVLDATSNEPWGPHGTVLGEIAQATKKFTECQLIMNALWTRLADSGCNWRHVYKALAVIEYLIGNGSERAVDDIIEHSFQISSLSGFEYVEPNGKDVGMNVRKKVETILTLLNNKDKIQEVRNKAAANRDKYIGLSSSGMSYKPSSTSYGSSSFYRDDHHGGFGGTKDSEMHKSRDRDDDDADWNHAKRESYSRDGHDRSRLRSNLGHQDEGTVSKKESTYSARHEDSYGPIPSTQSSSSLQKNAENDFDDDFDPRGSSTTGSAAGRPNQVDLFGESLIGDLIDAPVPIMNATTNGNTSTEVDLFADAAFVSASPNMEAHGGSHTEASVDLFAPSAFPAASSSTVDFFAAAADYSSPAEVKPSKSETTGTMADPFAAPSKSESTSSSVVDPFAALPLNNFEGSDLFGDFTSHTAPASNGQPEKSAGEDFSVSNQSMLKEAKTTAKKDTFQVKSGIWADSLSRGLIDLNISAPKKVSLADIGIVGGLSDGTDEKEKGPPVSTYGMGRAMGAGSGMGKSGFNSTSSGGMGMGRGDGSFSKLSQYDFGSFK